jgi:hypothetical protein
MSLTKNRKIQNLPLLNGGVYFFYIFDTMNRLVTKLLCINFRQNDTRRRKRVKKIEKSIRELNPDE